MIIGGEANDELVAEPVGKSELVRCNNDKSPQIRKKYAEK